MSNLIKLWDFPGGIYPPENKSQSMQLPLGKLTIPPQLIIPLNQYNDTLAKPVVNIGDKVLAGQLIAIADGAFGTHVHASSSGIVSAIGNYVLPHPSGLSSLSIVIDTDGKHEWIALEACENFLEHDRTILLEKIRNAGVAGLGGAGFPTDVKLSATSAQKPTPKIETLIINGAECEPYITADDMLMQTSAEDIIAGAYLLGYILQNPGRIVIAVENNKPNAITALQNAVKNFTGIKTRQQKADQEIEQKIEIEIAIIPTKYPSGGAKQLIQTLTGLETPSAHHSADIGIICINVATVAAAWRAVRFGEPLVSRITTVVGEALTIQRNIEVLFGTPINTVLTQHGFDTHKASRVIMGGPLMGFTLPDLRAPIIKATNCILAASKKELPPPPPAQACIRCGLCSEVCPASLLPQQLFWYAQANDLERLQAHNIFDCIECGACSYVCPSKIPLVQYYRAGKGSIQLQRTEKENADRARQRFEFRKERLAKEVADKEAKRIARKTVTEQTKQQLEKLQQDTQVNAPHVKAISAGIAKANTIQQTPEEQKARLERLVATAKNFLASASATLVPRNPEFPITEVQLIQQQSRIKQAELKLKEAEKKLADFINSTAQSTQPIAEDPIAATIARAQAKITQAPDEKLRANIAALQSRLAKAQERAAQAKQENNPIADALAQGVEKMQQKIAEVEAELAELLSRSLSTPNIELETQNAAMLAIERAKAKAAALANMSDEEKHAEQIQAVQLRLQKAKDRLQKAEAESDKNTEAFRTAVIKLEEKLKEISSPGQN